MHAPATRIQNEPSFDYSNSIHLKWTQNKVIICACLEFSWKAITSLHELMSWSEGLHSVTSPGLWPGTHCLLGHSSEMTRQEVAKQHMTQPITLPDEATKTLLAHGLPWLHPVFSCTHLSGSLSFQAPSFTVHHPTGMWALSGRSAFLHLLRSPHGWCSACTWGMVLQHLGTSQMRSAPSLPPYVPILGLFQ